MMDMVKRFAELLEEQQKERLRRDKMACEANLNNCKTRVIDGQKYIKVDVGTSGKYMIEKSSGTIFGIKGYGVIHRGHQYGTLDTMEQWDWGGYVGVKQMCTCGNPEMGCDCVCHWVKTHPGDKDYSCIFCGIYTAGAPRCNECKEYKNETKTTTKRGGDEKNS